MNFRIQGLSSKPFTHLYGLSDEALAEHNAKRYVADTQPGFPDRIELRDLEPGESVLLVNYEHQPAHSPFRSRHAIFVREGAEETRLYLDEVPQMLRMRPISLRAFDARHWMVDADVCAGDEVEAMIRRLLANPQTQYLHAHFAKRGCYAALIERA